MHLVQPSGASPFSKSLQIPKSVDLLFCLFTEKNVFLRGGVIERREKEVKRREFCPPALLFYFYFPLLFLCLLLRVGGPGGPKNLGWTYFHTGELTR